jgi:uncharacterized protein (DUF1330 family)
MPAYMILIRDEPVRDPAEMAIYQRMNREKPNPFKLKPLVVYGAAEAVEGPQPDGVLILEFPDVAEAKAWYDSPAYQAALVHRKAAADYRAIIVEGL